MKQHLRAFVSVNLISINNNRPAENIHGYKHSLSIYLILKLNDLDNEIAIIRKSHNFYHNNDERFILLKWLYILDLLREKFISNLSFRRKIEYLYIRIKSINCTYYMPS